MKNIPYFLPVVYIVIMYGATIIPQTWKTVFSAKEINQDYYILSIQSTHRTIFVANRILNVTHINIYITAIFVWRKMYQIHSNIFFRLTETSMIMM